MKGHFNLNKKLQKTHTLMTYSISSNKKVLDSPKNIQGKHKENYSTSASPKQSLTPHKYMLKKTPSKLFQKAHQTDSGQTYLPGSSTICQKFVSSHKSPSLKGKCRPNSIQLKDHREHHLAIQQVFNICIDGTPSLSQIIYQFIDKTILPNITQNSDQIPEIHSKLEQSHQSGTHQVE